MTNNCPKNRDFIAILLFGFESILLYGMAHSCQTSIDAILYCMDSKSIYHLLDRLGNLIRNEERESGNELGLQPVHLHVLRYLSICNQYSDTPQAVSDYLGITKGTASQTILVLQNKKLLSKKQDATDKRKFHLAITRSGEKLVESSTPPPLLSHAIEALPESTKKKLASDLTSLLKSLQFKNSSYSFGVCKTCHHFIDNGTNYLCGLTREQLHSADVEKICREHDSEFE